MSNRAFVIFSCAIAFAIVVGTGVINYLVDPLLQYRPPGPSARYDMNLQRQINPGRVRNLDFDTVMIGSSTTENFRQSEIDRLFGGNSLNLAFSGMRVFEVRAMMEYALGQKKVKRAIVSLDFFAFMPFKEEEDRMRDFPREFYDSSILNDYAYLLNFEMLKRSVYQVVGLKASISNHDGDAPWYWGDKKRQSRAAVLADWARKRLQGTGIHWPVDDMVERFILNILEPVDRNPSTRFELFFPPFSIVGWLLTSETGNLEAAFKFRSRIVQMTAGRANLRIHDFQADAGITSDLDHYTDIGHYGPGISGQLLKRMASGECMVDPAKVGENNDRIRKQIEMLDFAGLEKEVAAVR